ncbi:MAG: glycosyl hydrolase family protein [Chloroflexi bacterium]|nr:MAG: glycosyl hydrolase family protein [Chloroflexota bacterium]
MVNLRSNNDALVLRHQPYGEYHPYIPLPFERMPRNPASGEVIVLNIETEHNQSVQSVWCLWSAEGKDLSSRIDAVAISKDESLDHWQVFLPSFSGCETVHYRLFAENKNQKTESEEFSFLVSSWIKVNSIISVEDTDNKLDIRLSTERSGLYLRLLIEPDSGKSLSLKLLAVQETSLTTSTLTSFSKVWDDLEITLKNGPFSFELSRKSDGLQLKTQRPLKVLVNVDGEVLQYHLCFESPADEAFYGFGERFNALNQRGNHLDNYVYGQYTSQGKRTYIPVPFFISSRGYGLWMKTDRQAEFDMAAARPDSWAITGHAEGDSNLELKFFVQPQPFEIVKAFTDLTGKPKLPPTWMFGLWMSSNDWNSQAEVIKQLHETQKQGIPASVLVIEAWSDEMTFYIWNDALYQKNLHLKPWLY